VGKTWSNGQFEKSQGEWNQIKRQTKNANGKGRDVKEDSGNEGIVVLDLSQKGGRGHREYANMGGASEKSLEAK